MIKFIIGGIVIFFVVLGYSLIKISGEEEERMGLK